VISPQRSASVQGDNLHALLAATVLEREGFAVVTSGAGDVQITISDGARWEAARGENRLKGANFASLAACLRQFRDAANKIA
jgi:hypothetical protein